MLSAIELLEKSWNLFKNGWRSLVPYMVLLFVPTLALSILGIVGAKLATWSPNSVMPTNVIVLVAYVASLVFSIWVTVALTKALGTLEAGAPAEDWQAVFNATAPHMWPFIYTSILAGLVVIGGTLLFIVPGIIFAVWYAFVLYAVVLDDKRGMEALRASKAVVTGRWLAIVWRLILPGVAFVIASAVLRLVIVVPLSLAIRDAANLTIADNIITSLVSSIITPIATLAPLILYRNAKKVAVQPAAPLAS